jgi:hypothetical protein
MGYQEASPELDQRFDALVVALASAPDDQVLQSSAADLAYSIRSRCIDLATWKADYSTEYKKRVAQAAKLTKLAGKQADEVLLREFGCPGA